MSGANNGGWANPAPAGLVALAVACFTFFALLSGRVETGALPLLGCWLIGGFVVQVIVGIVELRLGSTTGGNIFTFFCAFFMLVGGLEFFVKYAAVVNGWQLDTLIDGWAWLPLAISLILWTPAYLKEPLVLCVIVFILDVAVMMVALLDLKVLAHDYAPLAGTLLLCAGILALYLAAAIVVNTAFKRNVFPMPGPLSK